MNNRETLQAYFLSVGEALTRHNTAFREQHPEVDNIDAVFVVEVTIDGQPMSGSTCNLDSTKEQLDRDVLNTERSVELCIRLVRACAS